MTGNALPSDRQARAGRYVRQSTGYRAFIPAPLPPQRVLEHLYERPIISVEQVRTITGTTYPAANQLVHKLVEHGILSESTGQKRHRRFRYDAYIRLFDEPEPTPQEIGP